MTSATPARRRRPTAAVKQPEFQEPAVTVTDDNPVQESNNVNENTEANTEVASPENPAPNGTERARPGRKPMDEATRQRRATYRACEAARKLLEDNGFTVTEPDGWENPETDRLKDAANRALEALRAAGIDPATLIQSAE